MRCVLGNSVEGTLHIKPSTTAPCFLKETTPLSHSPLEFDLSSCLSYSRVSTEIGPRTKAGKSSIEKIGTARGTLRLRSKGPATVEELVCHVQ